MDQNNRYHDETKMIGHLFTQTAEGRKVLELLKERYYDVIVANPDDNPNRAFYIEGSRKVIRDLIQSTTDTNEE